MSKPTCFGRTYDRFHSMTPPRPFIGQEGKAFIFVQWKDSKDDWQLDEPVCVGCWPSTRTSTARQCCSSQSLQRRSLLWYIANLRLCNWRPCGWWKHQWSRLLCPESSWLCGHLWTVAGRWTCTRIPGRRCCEAAWIWAGAVGWGRVLRASFGWR